MCVILTETAPILARGQGAGSDIWTILHQSTVGADKTGVDRTHPLFHKQQGV